jgi:hypothetical protein
MKKYQIIYADPAWLYQCGKNHLAKKSMINGKTDIHYNGMPIKEMEHMKINEITDNDCLLFMWVTSPFLKIGIDLMNKWGFDFSTIGFVWYKEKTNPDSDERGPWESGIISFEEGHKNEDKKSEYYYTITTPSGKKITRHFFVNETKKLMRKLRKL